jgi:hypothetical protein
MARILVMMVLSGFEYDRSRGRAARAIDHKPRPMCRPRSMRA